MHVSPHKVHGALTIEGGGSFWKSDLMKLSQSKLRERGDENVYYNVFFNSHMNHAQGGAVCILHV